MKHRFADLWIHLISHCTPPQRQTHSNFMTIPSPQHSHPSPKSLLILTSPNNFVPRQPRHPYDEAVIAKEDSGYAASSSREIW